ncbi:MAG: twin-arginine translocase TatA/TatE family subunit [Bacillota bacterium]
MGSIGPWELILILLVALVVFGPNRLPEIGKAVGKGAVEFRRALRSIDSDEASDDHPRNP